MTSEILIRQDFLSRRDLITKLTDDDDAYLTISSLPFQFVLSDDNVTCPVYPHPSLIPELMVGTGAVHL